MKKKSLAIVGAVLVFAVASGGTYYWYQNIKVPHDNAVQKFDDSKRKIEVENTALDKEIDDAQKVLNSKEQPYDRNTFTELQVAIADAKDKKVKIPKLPNSTDEINSVSKKMNEPIDYTTVISVLEEKETDALDSIKQQQQVTNPSEEFIIKRLNGIDKIKDFQAVTEDNDPNGNLNKQGGYTSTVYFTSSDLNQEEIFGNSLIEKGTDAGGSIEVYANKEDADNRNEYLSAFDGGILSAGSHSVLGTIVIRTSDMLTATQQKELENKIIDSFLKL